MSVDEDPSDEEVRFPIRMEDCGVYQDERYDCDGFGRGTMCIDNCRYMEASWERWERQARERNKWIHGVVEQPYAESG